MSYQCVNDPIWSYCKDEERWKAEHEKIRKQFTDLKTISAGHLKCTLDKTTCGFNYKQDAKIDNRLTGNSLKETIIPVIQKEKPKSSKSKKQEVEQESMF